VLCSFQQFNCHTFRTSLFGAGRPRQEMDKRRLGWGVVLVSYALVIFVGSSMTISGEHKLMWFPGSDKLLHALEFGLFYFFSWKLFRVHRVVSAFLLTAIYAGSDELHQVFVATRQASILDWLADIAGAGCGATGIFLFLRYCLPGLSQDRILATDTKDREGS
jgi:VanZ family protein